MFSHKHLCSSRYNLCTGTVEETRALCQRILEDVFVPSLAKKNDHFDEMGNAMLQSLWPINFNIDPVAFMTFTFHLASSTARNNNHYIKIGNFSSSNKCIKFLNSKERYDKI